MSQQELRRQTNHLDLQTHADNQQALIHDSSGLMSAPSLWSVAKQSLFSSKEVRQEQKRLSKELLVEAEREQAALLKHGADAARLTIDVAYQIQLDELRITHRVAMDELSKASEGQLRKSVNTLFTTKKSIIGELDQLDGDRGLIERAAAYVDMLTSTSASELIERNTKPR